MSSSNLYKQYNRTSRVQTEEEQFKSGMSYKDTPLQEGFCKLLINTDISDDGEYIKHRPALTITKTVPLKDAAGNAENTASLKLADSRNCAEVDGKVYSQIIVNEQVEDTSYVKAYTIDEAGTCLNSDWVPVDLYKPKQAEIHGMAIDVDFLSKQIGCFGYNNRYFFFDNESSLRYTLFDETDKKYKMATVTVTPVGPTEAGSHGYNMLSDTPYAFTDNYAEEGTLVITGFLCYKDDTYVEPEMHPKRNHTYNYRWYYTGDPTTYEFYFEWKDPGSSEWNLIKKVVGYAENTPIAMTFASPVKEALIRLRVMDTSGEIDVVTQATTWVYEFDKKNPKATDFVNYDLSTATIMCFWKERLVVAGMPQDPTILMTSRPEDPGYFPYPNAFDSFDEPIKNIVPYMDSLIVFTQTKLYQVSLGEDGISFYKMCLQEHLNIADWDRHLTRTVKNMLFFKSGNYYYMVVPKKNSLTGELTIAPISANIKDFLDDFENNVKRVMSEVYSYKGALTLAHYYNFLDYESVYNNYVFKTDYDVYVNFCLLYNSVKRYWKINIYESEGMLYPHIQDATKNGILINLDYKENNVLRYKEHKADTIKEYTPEGRFCRFNNKLYIDTGDRLFNTEVKKRYREFQMRIENPTKRELNLGVDFLVDGIEKINSYDYIPSYNPQTNEISMVQEVINPITVAPSTHLNLWVLNKSTFPVESTIKLRFPVAGKGYCPRVKLISDNEYPIKIQNMIWVYRIMNSR